MLCTAVAALQVASGGASLSCWLHWKWQCLLHLSKRRQLALITYVTLCCCCPAGDEWRRKLELLAALEVAAPAAAAAAHKVNKRQLLNKGVDAVLFYVRSVSVLCAADV
jgi:hypothetical protein